MAAGLCTGLALSAACSAPPLTAVAITSEALVGSLFPDIDHKDSFISRKLKPVGWIARLFFGHRTFFHSLVVYAAFFASLWVWKPTAAMIFLPSLAGIASHIFLDALNPRGVPLLFKPRIHLANIYTGSKKEDCLRFFLCVSGVGLSGYYAVCQIR